MTGRARWDPFGLGLRHSRRVGHADSVFQFPTSPWGLDDAPLSLVHSATAVEVIVRYLDTDRLYVPPCDARRSVAMQRPIDGEPLEIASIAYGGDRGSVSALCRRIRR